MWYPSYGRGLPAAWHAAVDQWHVGRVCPQARVAAAEWQGLYRRETGSHPICSPSGVH
jgi:hypothetical protein